MRKSLSYILLLTAVGFTAASALHAADPDFGPNVIIFDQSMPVSQIQKTVSAIADQQVSNQFGPQRYALLFKPGVYGSESNPLMFQVGFYTEVAGLGESPNDVVINGKIDVYNQCFGSNNCIALDNFWRSLSNLTINVPSGLKGCRANDFWAVSQASPMRRVNINGGFTLMDYCTLPAYASGGFISDSKTGSVVNGSQQQFIMRNSITTGWSNGVWNQVFSGVVGAPAQQFPPRPNGNPYTTLTTSPITREKPFLYLDSSNQYRVFVPSAQADSSGITWGNGPTPGDSLPISDFLIVTPATPSSAIDAASKLQQNLLFTPGVYNIDRPIVVSRPDEVVLGLGFATLSPQHGTSAMDVSSDHGVKIAGLLFDAGPKSSPVLLKVGNGRGQVSEDALDPTTLSDVFFRVGGAALGKADTTLIVNSSNVLLDDVWAWRADHGTGVGWTSNTADHGLIVNGNNVTAYGLFVEHFQKEEVIWNGENGRTIMFQNEMPYDPPSQDAWKHGNQLGYPAYKVADSVMTHQAWGVGSYCFFELGLPIRATNAFEVPVATGVQMHDLLTVFLNGSGGIDNVINNTGGPTTSAGKPTYLVSFP